jgi:hypothetical protein
VRLFDPYQRSEVLGSSQGTSSAELQHHASSSSIARGPSWPEPSAVGFGFGSTSTPDYQSWLPASFQMPSNIGANPVPGIAPHFSTPNDTVLYVRYRFFLTFHCVIVCFPQNRSTIAPCIGLWLFPQRISISCFHFIQYIRTTHAFRFPRRISFRRPYFR